MYKYTLQPERYALTLRALTHMSREELKKLRRSIFKELSRRDREGVRYQGDGKQKSLYVGETDDPKRVLAAKRSRRR